MLLDDACTYYLYYFWSGLYVYDKNTSLWDSILLVWMYFPFLLYYSTNLVHFFYFAYFCTSAILHSLMNFRPGIQYFSFVYRYYIKLSLMIKFLQFTFIFILTLYSQICRSTVLFMTPTTNVHTIFIDGLLIIFLFPSLCTYYLFWSNCIYIYIYIIHRYYYYTVGWKILRYIKCMLNILRHQAALDRLFYIIIVLALFEFFTAGFFGLLALNSKKSWTIVIQDNWTRPVLWRE